MRFMARARLGKVENRTGVRAKIVENRILLSMELPSSTGNRGPSAPQQSRAARPLFRLDLDLRERPLYGSLINMNDRCDIGGA